MRTDLKPMATPPAPVLSSFPGGLMRASRAGLLPRARQGSAGFNDYSSELDPLESPCGPNPAKCIESDRSAFATSGANAEEKQIVPFASIIHA